MNFKLCLSNFVDMYKWDTLEAQALDIVDVQTVFVQVLPVLACQCQVLEKLHVFHFPRFYEYQDVLSYFVWIDILQINVPVLYLNMLRIIVLFDSSSFCRKIRYFENKIQIRSIFQIFRRKNKNWDNIFVYLHFENKWYRKLRPR